MSTYTIQPQEHHRLSEWSLRHPVVVTAVAVVAAVVAGALIGLLFSLLFTAAPVAQQHRAGGHHARVAAVHTGAAAVTAESANGTVTVSVKSRKRSPARGGFAVGRTAGADDGFIEIAAATRAPVRGGFAGRSLGAGHAPGAALLRQTASK